MLSRRVAQHGGQLVKHGLAQAGRHVPGHARNHAAHGVVRGLRLPDAGLHQGGGFGVRAAHGVGIDEA